jgi:hypothetical protein
MLIDSDSVLFERYVFSSSLVNTTRHASEHFSTTFIIDLFDIYE